MKLNDITPPEFACGNCGCGCPAVLETENDTYIIIGKKTVRLRHGRGCRPRRR